MKVDYESVIQGLEMLVLHLNKISKWKKFVENPVMKQHLTVQKSYSSCMMIKLKISVKSLNDSKKNIVLRNMDRNWIEHIDMMDKLRNGIHLRAYAQNNPLQAYIEEGYEMFEEMQQRIAREVVFFAMKLEIQRTETEA